MPNVGQVTLHTSSYSPVNSTTPITYAWSAVTADTQSPTNNVTFSPNTTSPNVSIQWHALGSYIVRLTVSNGCSTQVFSRAYTVTPSVPTPLPLPVPVPTPTATCVAITNFSVNASSTNNYGNVSNSTTINVYDPRPPAVTGPFRYTYNVIYANPSSGTSEIIYSTGEIGTNSFTYNWPQSGSYTIQVILRNACSSFVKNFPYTISTLPTPLPSPPAPIACTTISAVAITSSTGTGTVGSSTIINASVLPNGANADSNIYPVTYTFEMLNSSNVVIDTQTGLSTSYLYNWTAAGTYTVRVSATNSCSGVTTNTIPITVVAAPTPIPIPVPQPIPVPVPVPQPVPVPVPVCIPISSFFLSYNSATTVGSTAQVIAQLSQISPSNRTTPINYVYSVLNSSGTVIATTGNTTADTYNYTFTVAGTFIIRVVISNACSTQTREVAYTIVPAPTPQPVPIPVPVPQPVPIPVPVPTPVCINISTVNTTSSTGTSGIVGNSTTVIVPSVTPSNASLPYSYTFSVLNAGGTVIQSSGPISTNSFSYVWTSAGTFTIRVAVSNACSTQTVNLPYTVIAPPTPQPIPVPIPVPQPVPVPIPVPVCVAITSASFTV